MPVLAQRPTVPTPPSEGEPSRDLISFLFALRDEWRVRRQIASAQMLDCASLRDIGLAPGGVESAIRHGRGRSAHRDQQTILRTRA